MLENKALRNIPEGGLELPADLQFLDKTAILWPLNPDGAAIEIAKKMHELLGTKIAVVIGYADNCPLKNIEYRRIDAKETLFFGYPKSSAIEKTRGFTASIDLSPIFELKLSGLPAIAGIPLRLGRDASKSGDFYNIILTSGSGAEIETLIGAMKK
jgi:hypothetical protein